MATAKVSFVSTDNLVVDIPLDFLDRSTVLNMFYQRTEQVPIKVGVSAQDLSIVFASMTLGMLPCPHQKILCPQDFASFAEINDYFDLDLPYDDGNDHLNEFLTLLGLDTDPGDGKIDPREGWTDLMIAEQEEDDRRATKQIADFERYLDTLDYESEFDEFL